LKKWSQQAVSQITKLSTTLIPKFAFIGHRLNIVVKSFILTNIRFFAVSAAALYRLCPVLSCSLIAAATCQDADERLMQFGDAA